MNQCSVCGVDFASLAAFDEHVLSAPGEPDFDCLQVAQMQQAGWGSERQGPLDESEDRSRRRESSSPLPAGSGLGASLDARDATPTRQSPFGSLAELWKSSRAAASLRWQAWSLRFSSCSWGPSWRPSLRTSSPRGEQAARFGSSRSCLPFLSLWQLDCSCRYGGVSQAARAHDSARSHTPRDVFTAQQEN
jgi:hypothetical protein